MSEMECRGGCLRMVFYFGFYRVIFFNLVEFFYFLRLGL